MSLEQLDLALDQRLEDLKLEFGDHPELVLPIAFRDQLDVFRNRLGGSTRERLLLDLYGEFAQIVEEIPIVKLDELPLAWADFKPTLPIESPGIGQIYFSARRSAEFVKATGWLLHLETERRDLIVTNSHVLTQIGAILGSEPSDFTASEIRRIEISFAGTIDEDATYFRANGFHMDPCFDIAVIRLEQELPDGIASFQLSDQEPESDMQVVTLGYPGRLAVFSEEDRLAYQRNYPYPPNMRVASPGRIRKVCGFQVEHTCTLAPGSSGSPLFGQDGSVVAVHHFGERWKRNLAISGGEVRRMITEMAL